MPRLHLHIISILACAVMLFASLLSVTTPVPALAQAAHGAKGMNVLPPGSFGIPIINVVCDKDKQRDCYARCSDEPAHRGMKFCEENKEGRLCNRTEAGRRMLEEVGRRLADCDENCAKESRCRQLHKG